MSKAAGIATTKTAMKSNGKAASKTVLKAASKAASKTAVKSKAKSVGKTASKAITSPQTALRFPQSDEEIEAALLEFFHENYEMLRLTGGHQLAPEVLAAAREQVLHYWRKLRDVAEKVTETEVKLTLSGQTTAKGKPFGIEGVVDIVREDDRVTMYDLKTHDADYIRNNVSDYQGQLNVYAHIWQTLRGNELHETKIISTVLPWGLRDALRDGGRNTERIAYELERWEPLVDVPFDAKGVAATIEAFGNIVDRIEDHDFAPRDVATLKERKPGQSATFATNVCRNCDARFSCESYRAFALRSGAARNRTFHQFFVETETDAEREDRLTAGALSLESSAHEELDDND